MSTAAYTSVPGASPGQAITSRQQRILARAENDRLRFGAGDATFRIHAALASATRQIRNPDADNNFPPSLELLEYYIHTSPSVPWPVADPGDPEGVNVASTFPAFVYGNDSLQSEDNRLSGTNFVPLLIGGHGPTSVSEAWQLAREQRGLYDPDTNQINAPCYENATSYWPSEANQNNYFSKLYGGYLPVPPLDETFPRCSDTEAILPDNAPIYNYHRFFTSNDPANFPDKVYPGSCPFGDSAYSPTGAQNVVKTPRSFFVFRNDGGVDVLSTKVYVEGPYTTGGFPHHDYGQTISRLGINQYIKEFRGSVAQRGTLDSNGNPVDVATKYGFDFNNFFRSQYLLAPNLGVFNSGTGEIDASYPSFSYEGEASFPAGTLAQYSGGGTSHQYRVGFVLGGVAAQAVGIISPCTFEVMGGHESNLVIGTFTLTPDGSNNAEALLTFNSGLSPDLRIRIKSGSTLQFSDDTGTLVIEASEIMAYKPEIEDAYLVLRLAVALTVDGPQNSGLDEELSKSISDTYFSQGYLMGRSEGLSGVDAINQDAVFDSARRFIRSNVRVIPFASLATSNPLIVGYEVINEGGTEKSVLYCKRFLNAADPDNRMDMFEGIAPNPDPIPSGILSIGARYIVKGGSLTFVWPGHTIDRTAGTIFTADAQEETWTGAGTVYEYSLIIHPEDSIRPAKSFTNEWLMFESANVYSNSDTSFYKPDLYAFQNGIVNRCHVLPQSRFALDDFASMLSPGDATLSTPESPSGWNYMQIGGNGLNQGDIATDFRNSCRIYEPDDEIDYCTSDLEGADEVVRIVFKKRFRNPGTAACARDPMSWDVADLNTFGALGEGLSGNMRETTIRSYLRHVADPGGYNCPRSRPGDTEASSALYTGLDESVFGACFPRLFFTRLIGESFEDNNDTSEKTDSTFRVDEMQQLEFYIAAQCGGFVDDTTTKNLCGTDLSNVIDFTFTNLCQAGFNGTWVSPLPLSARTDNLGGFGPLPSIPGYADIYNRYATMLNLMNRVRLMIPFKVQSCFKTGTATAGAGQFTTSYLNDPSWASCGAQYAGWLSGTMPNVPVDCGISESDDPICVGFPCGISVQSSMSLDTSGTCDGSGFFIAASRQKAHFELQPRDDDVALSIPPTISGLVASGGSGVYGVRTTTVITSRAVQVGTSAESFVWDPAGDRRFWDGTIGYNFVTDTETTTECLLFSGTIELDSGDCPATDTGAALYGPLGTGQGPEGFGGSTRVVAIALLDSSSWVLTVPLVAFTDTPLRP